MTLFSEGSLLVAALAVLDSGMCALSSTNSTWGLLRVLTTNGLVKLALVFRDLMPSGDAFPKENPIWMLDRCGRLTLGVVDDALACSNDNFWKLVAVWKPAGASDCLLLKFSVGA